MGTVIVGAIVVGVVGLIVRSMVKDKKSGSHFSAEATAVTVEVIVTKQRNVKDGQPMQQGNMQKEAILNRLRQRGCRITKQRMLLLDIILEEECSSCKEIYYKASKIDSSIGSATVYRMINMLERSGQSTVATCTRFLYRM